jgi:hypothetical protein
VLQSDPRSMTIVTCDMITGLVGFLWSILVWNHGETQSLPVID